ncbi:hypothetical protein CaCOL14_009307 [Colletotrichum acutatum]
MTDLQDALDYFQSKYALSLGNPHRHLNTKSIGKKIEYRFREKERLEVLQQKLSRYTQLFSVLLAIHTKKAAHVDNATMQTRIQEVVSQMDVISLDINRQGTQISEQHTSIEVLATKVDAANGYLIRQGDAKNTLTEMTKKNELCIKELASMIESKVHLLVQEREDETCHRFFSGPGSNTQRPLFFEDALGVVLTLPIEWLESWKHLRSLISNRFENRMGHRKVLRGEYALEDEANGAEVTLLPWNKAIRPGRKINMAMKFQRVEEVSKAEDHVYICPGCKAVRSDIQDDQINLKCATPSCGMWMRSSRTRLEGNPQQVAENDTSLTADEDSMEEDDDPRHFHRVLFNIFVLSSPLPKENASPTRIADLEECDPSDENSCEGKESHISKANSSHLSRRVHSSHETDRHVKKSTSSRRQVSSRILRRPKAEYRCGWTCCCCYWSGISMSECSCLYCQHMICLNCRVATVSVKEEQRKV